MEQNKQSVEDEVNRIKGLVKQICEDGKAHLVRQIVYKVARSGKLLTEHIILLGVVRNEEDKLG